MKPDKDELTQRYLLLFKLDAQNLLERVRSRRREFVEVFSLRRTREHFPWVFHSRYPRATIKDLVHCSTETIVALDQFHALADEMKWYLYQTEDMPSTVETNVAAMVKRLEKLHATLALYLDAEMGLAAPEGLAPDAFADAPGEQMDAEENLFRPDAEEEA